MPFDVRAREKVCLYTRVNYPRSSRSLARVVPRSISWLLSVVIDWDGEIYWLLMIHFSRCLVFASMDRLVGC